MDFLELRMQHFRGPFRTALETTIASQFRAGRLFAPTTVADTIDGDYSAGAVLSTLAVNEDWLIFFIGQHSDRLLHSRNLF